MNEKWSLPHGFLANNSKARKKGLWLPRGISEHACDVQLRLLKSSNKAIRFCSLNQILPFVVWSLPFYLPASPHLQMPPVRLIPTCKYDTFVFSREKWLPQTIATPKWLLNHCKMMRGILNEPACPFTFHHSSTFERYSYFLRQENMFLNELIIHLQGQMCLDLPVSLAFLLLPLASGSRLAASPAWMSDVVLIHLLTRADPGGCPERGERGPEEVIELDINIITLSITYWTFVTCQALSEHYL